MSECNHRWTDEDGCPEQCDGVAVLLGYCERHGPHHVEGFERLREQLARYSECPDPDCGGIVQHDGAHHYCATCHVRAAARINESALQGTLQREREAVREVVEAAQWAVTEVLEFHEGSEEPKGHGGKPVVWINAGDFNEVLSKLRTALSRLEEQSIDWTGVDDAH